jgi:hypothetical protein
MKSNELRIGNLVQCLDIETEQWCVDKVSDINEDDFYTKDESEGNAIANMEIKPIPLTEEWLIKFGFRSNPYEDKYELGNFHVQCNKTRVYLELWIELDICHVDLKHVHTLQNLYFALTGEELTIK